MSAAENFPRDKSALGRILMSDCHLSVDVKGS